MSPKIIGNSLSEHRARTRDALISALEKLMAEKGFDAVTMSDLAAEAEIGRTAIYNHFADKEEVLMAFIEREMAAYMESLETMLAESADPVTQLRQYVRTQLLTERAYFFAPSPPLKEVVSRETAHKIGTHVRQTGSVLTRILDDCITVDAIPEQDVRIAVQLIHGALTGRRVPKQDPERAHFFDATERFILHAVGANVPETLPDIGPIPAHEDCH